MLWYYYRRQQRRQAQWDAQILQCSGRMQRFELLPVRSATIAESSFGCGGTMKYEWGSICIRPRMLFRAHERYTICARTFRRMCWRDFAYLRCTQHATMCYIVIISAETPESYNKNMREHLLSLLVLYLFRVAVAASASIPWRKLIQSKTRWILLYEIPHKQPYLWNVCGLTVTLLATPKRAQPVHLCTSALYKLFQQLIDETISYII